MQQPMEPIDPELSAAIDGLKHRQVKIVALTNCFVGSFGDIRSMKDLLLKHLGDTGYDFKPLWKHVRNGHMDLPSGKRMIFQDGVIFTCNRMNKATKGECLEAFLQYSNFYPKEIIMIDDKMANLISVKNMAEQMDIQFVGVQFKAPAQIPKREMSEEHAKLQFDILIRKHKLLPDREIQERLRLRSNEQQ